MSGEKEVLICKVDVCACIMGAERSAARSSRTNGQWTKLKVYKKRLTTYICMFKGHLEVREVRLLWKKLPVQLHNQGWPTDS